MIRKSLRLKKRKDVDSILGQGRKLYFRGFVLRFLQTKQPFWRAAIICPKKTGKPFLRVRLKRRVGHALRANLKAIKPGFDFIFFLNAGLEKMDFKDLSAQITSALKKARII